MIGYGMPYMNNNYMNELQNMRDRIDSQIQQVQQQQQNMQQVPMQQPTNLTQNFQLAPTNQNTNFKLVNNIEEVQKEIIITETYFVAKDNSQMWIKNPKGDIRIFAMEEIIPKDEKDLLIEDLQRQINELKGGMSNASTYEQNDGTNDELLCKQSSTKFIKPVGEQFETNQSTNVSNIPTSKTTKRKP